MFHSCLYCRKLIGQYEHKSSYLIVDTFYVKLGSFYGWLGSIYYIRIDPYDESILLLNDRCKIVQIPLCSPQYPVSSGISLISFIGAKWPKLSIRDGWLAKEHGWKLFCGYGFEIANLGIKNFCLSMLIARKEMQTRNTWYLVLVRMKSISPYKYLNLVICKIVPWNGILIIMMMALIVTR
jgi:hypothetical protein